MEGLVGTKAVIEGLRLAGEDSLAADLMGEKERKKLRQKRTAKARRWNLLRDLEAKGLAHVPG
jgi:hypothetical protein